MEIVIGMEVLTLDYRVVVTGQLYDPLMGIVVFFDREERGDIGRYLYHKPLPMVTTAPNFTRLYLQEGELK